MKAPEVSMLRSIWLALALAGSACAQLGQTLDTEPGGQDPGPPQVEASEVPALRAEYRVEVPSPGARQVRITCRFTGPLGTQPRFGLVKAPAPGVQPTLTTYGLRDAITARAGRGEGLGATTFEWDGDPEDPQKDFRSIVALKVAVPAGADTVELSYALTLPRVSAEADLAGQSDEKDQVAVSERHAVLRGDTLMVPADHRVEAATTRLALPEGWQSFATFPQGFAGYPAPYAGLEATSWVALAAAPDVAVTADETLGGVRLMVAVIDNGRPAPTAQGQGGAPPPASDGPGARGPRRGPPGGGPLGPPPDPATTEEVRDMVLARARHYLQTFGSDPLSYLPRDDAGRPVLRVLAFESMAGGFSGGGQYLASSGTGVFLFSRQDKDGFGHTSAHEIFHAYNDTALAMAQGPPNVWWGEGFTDALAHLTHLRLSVTDPDQRAQRVRMLISEAFGRYSGIGGPPGPDGQPQGPKPLPAMPLIGADPQAYPEVYADHELYDRLVQQRPLLLMLRAATLMAKGGTPRPAEAWFTAALRAHGQHRDGAAAYSFESLRDLALAQAGNARDELAQFFSTYFEGTTQVDAASARAWAGDPAVAALVR